MLSPVAELLKEGQGYRTLGSTLINRDLRNYTMKQKIFVPAYQYKELRFGDQLYLSRIWCLFGDQLLFQDKIFVVFSLFLEINFF